ncbi:MFS transporter [Heyndrickxia acidiproducens]|uniref:MFS transporter n=1 Tax=Heyndrickxia acidiproducens TaxID=1121084 RepID=UPI0003767E8B|nr:MFS transporter [Heyndrickxia acidiproducens]
MNKRPKLWTKDFILISSTNFFTHVVFYLLMTTMALYVTSAYHTSQSTAGLAAGIFVIASLIARVFAGKYLDQWGRKRVIIWSLAVFFAVMVLHFAAGSLAVLMALRFIQGLMHGAITTAAGAIVADIIPNERRGEGTGYYATSMNLAMAIGPFLGMFISSVASFKMIILAASLIALIDLVSALFISVPEATVTRKQLKEMSGFHVKDFFEPAAVPISAVTFAITVAYSSLLTFLSLYAKDIHLAGVSSFFFIVYAVALVMTRPFTGKWFDVRGENFIVYPLLVILAAGFLLLSLAHNGWMLLASGALIGIGYGTVQSCFQAIAIKLSPPHHKALATSTFFIFIDLASGSGPYLLGIAAGSVSFRSLYLAISVWIVASIAIYYFAHGKKAALERKQVAAQHLRN